MHSTGTGQSVETQDVFFWRLAGRSAPTGLAIVHWIGCINAIKLYFMDPEDPYSDPDHFQNSIISSFYLFRNILKISSKSVHNFLIYLVHNYIWQPGSRGSRSFPKSNHLFLVSFWTFPENFIKIHP